jgi:hypothetical protein
MPIFDDAAFWQAIGYVLGVALATLAVALTTRYAARWLKEAWWTLRVYVPQVTAQVDEPTDPLLAALGRRLDAVWPAFEQHAAVFLPVFLRALAEGLDRALGATAPETREGVGGEAVR